MKNRWLQWLRGYNSLLDRAIAVFVV